MKNINTYGWDMVLAVKTSFINAKLSSGDQHFTEEVELTGQSVTVKCTTKCWQIAAGGSDALVNFKIPCSKMSLDNGKKSVSFTNGYCLVQSKLDLVAVDNGIHELRIQTNNSSIKVLDVSFPDSEFSEFVSYATLACQNWLDKNADIDYVLASTKLNSTGSPGMRSELIPTSATYAYTDSKNDDDGILGLLCSLSGKTDLAGSLQQISTDAIQSGKSAILINSNIVQNWLQPSISATKWANQPGVEAEVENPLDYQLILNT